MNDLVGDSAPEATQPTKPFLAIDAVKRINFSSAQNNVALIEAYYAAWSSGNPEAVMRFFTEESVFDERAFEARFEGLAQIRHFVDLTYALHRRVGEYSVYDLVEPNLASTITLDHNVLATVGFRF